MKKSLFLGLTVVLSSVANAASTTALESCKRWFAAKGGELIKRAQRQMNDGTVVYAPQGGDWYKATWLRDYVMMLEGELVPTQHMAGAAEVFLKAISPDGQSCDCVKFNGAVMRRPGYDTLGENPVLDGYPYVVSLVYETWRQTGDRRWLASDVFAKLRLASISRRPSDADRRTSGAAPMLSGSGSPTARRPMRSPPISSVRTTVSSRTDRFAICDPANIGRRTTNTVRLASIRTGFSGARPSAGSVGRLSASIPIWSTRPTRLFWPTIVGAGPMSGRLARSSIARTIWRASPCRCRACGAF